MDIEILGIFIYGIITIFSIGLFLISIISSYKYKNSKLVFVSLVFLAFFIKSLLISFSIFYRIFEISTFTYYLGLFDLVVLILLFIATLKRQ